MILLLLLRKSFLGIWRSWASRCNNGTRRHTCEGCMCGTIDVSAVILGHGQTTTSRPWRQTLVCLSGMFLALESSRLDQSMLAARSAPWLAEAQQADTGARVQSWWPGFCCHTCGQTKMTGQTELIWKSMDGRFDGRKHSSMTWFEFVASVSVAALCWAIASSMALTRACSGYGPGQTHGQRRRALNLLRKTSKTLCWRFEIYGKGASHPLNQLSNVTVMQILKQLLGVEMSQIVKQL